MRNSVIDVAKGIGIILVVFGHSWVVLHEKGELFRVVFSFHMALFFFLAATFMSVKKDFASFARTRAATLLKPYFVVLLAAFAFRFVSEQVRTRGAEPVKWDALMGIFYASGPTIMWGHLWFLPHLFVCSLVSYGLIRLLHRSKAALVVLSVVLLALGPKAIGSFEATSGLPWSIDLLPVTCAFLMLGYVVQERVRDFHPRYLFVALAAVVFCGLHYYFNETMDLMLREYGNPAVCAAQAVSAIYLILFASSWIVRIKVLGKVLAYLGSGSIFILIFHGIIQVKVFDALDARLHNPSLAAPMALVAGIAAPLLIWEMAKRVRPLGGLLLPRKRDNTATLAAA